jgi:hypothetical protein
MTKLFFRIVFILAVCLPVLLCAQNKPDTTKSEADTTRAEQLYQSIKNSDLSQRLLKSITRKQSNPVKTVKSEDVFKPYENKIIRKIIIRSVGFDKSVTDTTRNIRNTITKISNKLHGDSKEWLIKDNLFFRENKLLNPYKLADNERHLRDLDFILDAKLYILPLKHTKDSVDVMVLTRDVFSIGATFNPSNPTKTRFKLYDVNLAGHGQRFQFNGQIEDGRTPPFGYEMFYRKNSLGGSFVNASLGYTQLNTGSSYGDEQEKAYYVRLDRPLVSPYTRFAGALEISQNWSQNLYETSDSLFLNYRYTINDIWIGYNVGATNNSHDRSRHFITLRAFDQHFRKQPLQETVNNSPMYNNRKYLLAGLTFFKQNFYTTRYIYGFGRTEDIPYGHNMSLYIGWASQLGLQRPYIGFEAERAIVNKNGEFYNLGFKAGAFNNKGLEDATVLLSASLTSNLITYRQLLIRQSVSTDFTAVFNQRTTLPLNINDSYGLQGFSSDSIQGTKRFHINTETLVFTPLQILGFRFAPFTFAEMAVMAPYQNFLNKKPYFGFGGGVRTRNENLVFGTIEFRFFYYPRTVGDISNFKIRVSSNLRVKYTASFVKAPSFVQYN